MPATLKVYDLREWARVTRTSLLITGIANDVGLEQAVEQVYDGEPTLAQIQAVRDAMCDELDERIPHRGG